MNDAHRGPDPLLELLGGKARAQAVSTAAEIGLADVLAEGPLGLEELAARLECAADPLRSLLRLLSGAGLITQREPGQFELTDVGRRLRSDELGPLAAFIGAPEQWDPWSRLRQSLRGGAGAFERTHGKGLYDFLATDPEAARRYDRAIDAFTRLQAAALLERYDFGAARHLVDVGGGRGMLLEQILARWEHLRGTLFELAHVAAAAAPRLTARFGERACVESGDFFESVPLGADHYVVKHVLHNWPDGDAVRILEHCARAAGADGRVLIVEALLAPDYRGDLAAMLDLEMHVLTGGRVRRKPELRRLVQRAGLKTESLEPLTQDAWLLVARR